MHSRQLSRRPQPKTPLCLYFIKTIWMGNKDESTQEFNDLSAEKKQQYLTKFITWFRTLSAAEKQKYETGFNNLSAAEKRKLKDESLTSLKEYQKVSCCMRDPCTIDIYVSLHIYPPRCAFSLHPALRIIASVRT